MKTNQAPRLRPLLIVFVLLSFLFLSVFSWQDQRVSEYVLEEGKRTETAGIIIDSGRSGPIIYVVAGVHGNEPAGRLAAESLKELKLKRGKLYLLPAANRLACEEETRTVPSLGDLNRSFPGKNPGSDVRELAYAISSHIEAADADFILDLHESKNYRAGEVYAIGKSLIYTHPDTVELGEALVQHLNEREKETNPYVYFFDSKEGTLNHEVTNGLDRPAITFETDVEQALENRVADHKKVVLETLRYYGMIN